MLSNKLLNHFVVSIIIAIIATFGSYAFAFGLGWISTINGLEFIAVFTSYMCTYLCTQQTRWNYPIGILTTALYSVLFFQWGLYAMALFNLYLVGSLIYGWFRWGDDNNTKPVTRVGSFKWALGYAGLGVGIYLFLMLCNLWLGGTITNIEIWATVLSGIAQFLLDNKKIETWTIWAIVNVLSIWLYFNTGLFIVALQYVFFLANTVYGHYCWRKDLNKGVG